MENKIIEEILKEKQRQISLWGVQNHNIVDNNYYLNNIRIRYGLPTEEQAKYSCNQHTENKTLTWGDIIVEELAEALNAKTPEEMKEELIQCGAVIVSMIESLERNGK